MVLCFRGLFLQNALVALAKILCLLAGLTLHKLSMTPPHQWLETI